MPRLSFYAEQKSAMDTQIIIIIVKQNVQEPYIFYL